VEGQVHGPEELLKLPGQFGVAAHQARLPNLRSIVNPDATQVGDHIITAAGPLPHDFHGALDSIHRDTGAHQLSQLGNIPLKVASVVARQAATEAAKAARNLLRRMDTR
jgi:hypothetical protein